MASDPGAVRWKTLHPGSVAVNLIPRLWGVVRNLWPVALAFLYGSSQGDGLQLVDASLLLVFFGLAAWGTILHWATLRYRVSEGRLEVQTGLLNRQVRVISPDRIQNIELVRNVFQRVFGLVEVRIETASGTEVEGLLSALSVGEAEALVESLGKGRAREETEDAALPSIVENGLLDLVRHGATAGRLGAIAVLLGVATEWIQVSDPNDVEQWGGVLGTLGLIALVVAAFSGAFVLGIGSAVVRHHGFRLIRRGASLVATEGLFTTRQVELPLAKVQQVTVSEPVLRRMLGFGSVHIETAAAREGQGGIAHAEAMAPYVEAPEFPRVVRAALPDLDADLSELASTLEPPHHRALYRSLAVATTRGLILGGLATWWFGIWGAIGFGLVPLGWVTGWLDHKYQGWLVTDRAVIARRGWWSRATTLLDRNKLQSLQVTQGPFLRNYGLAVLRVRVAGSSVVLPVLSWDQAVDLQATLLMKPAPRELDPPVAVEE